LHTPVEIIERYHHSLDVFPDSGRILPFWSGATISYNMIDLKIKNTSEFPLQIKIFLTQNHLKWQILSAHPLKEKYHIIEKNHFFIKRWEKYFRYNELFREEKIEWVITNEAFLTSNFAPVLYDFQPDYLENHFELLDYSDRKI
jgi:vancomycin resistance protein VanW